MSRATIPLARHREVREKLAAAQTELTKVRAQRDELTRRLKLLGEQLNPMAQQMAMVVGENRALKAAMVRIYQQATEAGADLPKLQTFQTIPEGVKDGPSQAGQS